MKIYIKDKDRRYVEVGKVDWRLIRRAGERKKYKERDT